jgi:hypothetical protein
MYNTTLIQETLFDCLKHQFGIDCFSEIKWCRVIPKRMWALSTPEQNREHTRKMSEAQHNLPAKVKKKMLRAIAKGREKYYRELTDEQREAIRKHKSDRYKAEWEKAKTDKNHFFRRKAIKKIELIRDVPRINTYSGVITESQMEEINGAS